HADDLGGGQMLRDGGEVDDVGEQDRCRTELVRNRLRLGPGCGGDGGGRGWKWTTSANRTRAELTWSALVCVSALSLSAIDRGRMLSSRLSDRACSSRSAASGFGRGAADRGGGGV